MTPPPPLALAMRAAALVELQLLVSRLSGLSGLVLVVGNGPGDGVYAGGGTLVGLSIAHACSSLTSPADTMLARSGVSMLLVAVTEAVAATAFAASVSAMPLTDTTAPVPQMPSPLKPLPVLPPGVLLLRLPESMLVGERLGACALVSLGRDVGVNILRACSSEIVPAATISSRSGVRGTAGGAALCSSHCAYAIEGGVRGDVGCVISFLPQTWNAGSDVKLRRRGDKLKPSLTTADKGDQVRL